MLIDWFTVAAQAVNFLILVWLLKRFLYAPILNAIDVREKRIEAMLADAETKQTKADGSIDEYVSKLAALETERITILKLAIDDAEIARQRLLDKARIEAVDLRIKQQEQLQIEYLQIQEEVSRRTRVEVFTIAKKMLNELAGASIEERIVEVFIERLGKLDIEAQQHLSSASLVVVRTAFELSEPGGIAEAIRKLTTAGIAYEVVPALISGIVLIANGHKIAWNAADYLSTLEMDVNALIKSDLK